MKIRKISILSAIAFGAMIAFTGCSKDDQAIPGRVSVTEIPTLTTVTDATTGSSSIVLTNLGGFQGKFKVDLLFPGATPPTKIDVVVRKNTTTTIVNTNVKVYKADITALPTNFTVTAAEIAALFGAPIAAGETYDFAPNMYAGGKLYEAFPATGVGTGPGFGTMPGYFDYARYKAN